MTIFSKFWGYNAIDFLDPKNRVIAALDCITLACVDQVVLLHMSSLGISELMQLKVVSSGPFY